ncbi:hypothetical protein HN011_006102 [Eciton burchellii]|nr:hypothetical protein HN011_006102 [Eciton burchellii]
MAGYINRTMAQSSGENQLRTTDVRIDNSPLQMFVKAKKRINDIFENMKYVEESIEFMTSLPNEYNIVNVEEITTMRGYIDKVRAIRDILKRDRMKVAFFGTTSNGKSTVINAMLRNDILPSGIGHTTNCFLQVEASDNGESYLVTEDSTEKQPVQSVGQLAHALCKEKLCHNHLVRIFWPKDKCSLLRDDVVFVDSPGVSVTPNLDEWIDKHCLDADVFVFVLNAESTMMLPEKEFFHKVSAKLSKPNIFILYNRWDASVSVPQFLDQVRAQHLERAVEFLSKELRVYENTKDAEERVFFISAKEVLQARMQEQRGQLAHEGALADGFQNRYFEFQDFERKFEECISKSAVKTKFEQHSQRGKQIAIEIRDALDKILKRMEKKRSEQQNAKKEVDDKLNFTKQQLMLLTQEMKDKIHRIVEDVDQWVSKALSEEIPRLSILIDEFNIDFEHRSVYLNAYKQKLHMHVENGLGLNLRARLGTVIASNMENSQREMAERMANLLPENKRQMSLDILPRREPFQILYRLNCDNWCADFHEDLEFRFSWGFMAVIKRFAEKEGQILTAQISNGSQEALPDTAVSYPDNIARIAATSIASQGTMGGLIVAGFMLKTVGWRLIAITTAIYGALYLYERLTWTNKAKEREFKRQYVAHITQKLRLTMDFISSNCSHQVQQELSSTFARLCRVMDEATSEMDAELKIIANALPILEKAATKAKHLRNEANFSINEADTFDAAYLKPLE